MITLLGENISGQTPSQDELMEWADQYGLNHAVVADPGFGVTARFVSGGTIGLPSMDLLAAGAEVLIADEHVSDSDVSQNLP